MRPDLTARGSALGGLLAILGFWALVALLVVALAGMAGCVSREDIERARAQAASVRDELAARAEATDLRLARAAESLEALRVQLAEIPEEDPRRAAAEAALAAAGSIVGAMTAEAATIRAGASAATAAVATLDGVLQEYDQPTEPVGRLAEMVLPFVPTPYREPLMVGAAGLAALARARKLKVALRSIVRGFDAPEFAGAIDAHAAALRSVQTPTARAEVDAVQGGGDALRGLTGLLARLPV